MYAVVKEGGKQYRIKEGEVFTVEKVNEDIGKEIELKNVLMAGSEGDVKIGTPKLEGASVLCKVMGHKKEKKIIVFKHKRRKGYRKKQGHRQKTTSLKVLSIKS